jgi:hypothetical protein
MSENQPASTAPRDRVAECHTRAAADRLQAQGMDTSNGRRKLEHSAETWDQRAELYGRLDASFNKREQLDAEARSFRAAQRAELRAPIPGPPMGGEEAGVAFSGPSDGAPRLRRGDGSRATEGEG